MAHEDIRQDPTVRRVMGSIADSLSAIHADGVSVERLAEKTNIPRPIVSMLKNGAYHNAVNLDRIVVLLNLCGLELTIKRKRNLREVAASLKNET